MNKLYDLDNGGFPYQLNDLRWLLGQGTSDAGIYQAINMMLRSLGDDFIVYGCVLTSTTISEGLIMLAGELIHVDSHPITDTNFVKVETFNPSGSKVFRDTNTHDTYKEIRATVTASSGGFAFATAPTYESLTKGLNKYYAENYDGGEIDPSTVPSGQTWLGKGSSVKITELGQKVDGRLDVDGDIESDNGDIISPNGEVSAEGNITTNTGKFVGDNAPKMVSSVFASTSISITNLGDNMLASVSESSGVYTCAIPISVSGIVIFNVNAYAIDGGVVFPCTISAYKTSNTQFKFVVNYADGTGKPVPSATVGVYAQITAYW
jgi:hypothetical protein